MASWLTLAVSMAVMCAVVLADGYGYQKKTIKCYQCGYSPGKTVYREEKYPVQVESYDKYHKKVVKTIYKTRQVAEKKNGGWEACKGPFSHYEAKDNGVDVWDCHDNCYTRVDYAGNIFRGCYKEEWGVNPNKLGCHEQAGSTYCFCKGDKCNNQAAPASYHHAARAHETYEPVKHDAYEPAKHDAYQPSEHEDSYESYAPRRPSYY